MEPSKIKWTAEISEAIKQKKAVSMVWFVEEFNIEIKPDKDNYVNFRIEHGTQGFGESEIMSEEHAILHLKNYDKPDLMDIEK